VALNASHGMSAPQETPQTSDAEVVETAAALDLGSNSFHMIVGRLERGQLRIVDKLRERVRFAAGLDADRNIMPEAWDRALACLERFGERLDGMPSTRVRAVGTNTLRKARNSRKFLEHAAHALGYPIDIISGREEARLIYLGMAQSMPAIEGRRLVVDIGGGSTEIILGEGFDIVEADSKYMGCVSFSERFFGGGEITAKGFRKAQLAAELELQSIAQPYRRLGWTHAIGCSGTIHAVQEIVRANGWGDDGFTPKALKKLRKALVAVGSVDALDLPGLQPDRKPVIAGGVAIIEAIFLDLRIEQMVASPGALREGVLYDLVGRIRHEDVRDRTIKWFEEHYAVDAEQAARVEQTALTLLHQATKVWALDEARSERLLSWASRLFEIGLAIAHAGYHKHGGYLINYSHMAGFAREEQRTLSALVGGHRRKLRRDTFASIDPAQRADVLKLCVLFRLAVCLNRGRAAGLPRFVLKAKKERLKLHFPEGWLEEHPLTRTALEDESGYLAPHGFILTLHTAAGDPDGAKETETDG
jgi:exopolyphosphatase/guanosine-5'-triphosphate,3'-diphosphate pyrophosphatase